MDNSVQPAAPVVPDESVVMPGSNSTPPVSAAPANTTFSPTSSGNAKPKRKLGPIIATIFGLLLLVGGIGVGLVLVNQRQLINKKAAGVTGSGICAETQPATTNTLINGCNTCGDKQGTQIYCDSNGNPECIHTDPCGAQGSGTPGNFLGCGGSGGRAGTYCDNCYSDGKGGMTCNQDTRTSCSCQQGCLGAGTSSCGASGGGGGGTTPPTSTPVPGGCQSNWCTTDTQCKTIPGYTEGSGAGYCNPSDLVRCCVPAPVPTNPPAPLKDCGGTCKTTSDCITGEGGVTVACVGGVCQNNACVGHTMPGSICGCSNFNACGQGCSAAVGLCQAGSSCRYIGGNFTPTQCTSNQNQNNPTDTICVPDTLPTGYTLNTCGGDKYLLGPSGVRVTQAQIQQLCAPVTASCSNVKVYDANFNPLSIAQLSQLEAGTSINFTVFGTTTAGVFDQAQFTINGVQQSITTTTKPGSTGEFSFKYTLPSGVANFVVTAQLHQQSLNKWF